MSEIDLKCMPHVQYDNLNFLLIVLVLLCFSVPVLVVNFAETLTSRPQKKNAASGDSGKMCASKSQTSDLLRMWRNFN